MHVMEGRVGSGVLKKKNSSGCLIIKKVANKNSGGGLGGLVDSSKGKKRARLIESESSGSSSSSSDDDEDESLEFMRRKVNEKRLKQGSTGYKRNEVHNRESDRGNAGSDVSAEKKRSRLDLFEFDEYDEFDENNMRNMFLQDRSKKVGRNDGGNVKEFGADRWKQGSCINGSSSGRSKNVGNSGMRNKGLGSEDDEAHMPISLLKMKYRETAGELIRLQGKNGVLKVMVNKKKKMDYPSQYKNRDPVEKDLSAELPVFSDSKTPKNRGLLIGKERSVDKEKGDMKLEKANHVSRKNKKARDSGVDETDDTALRLAAPRTQTCTSNKAVKKEAERSPSTENFTPVKGKEGKEGNAKRGASTEKQKLREKIRGMLIDAGWSIDYRPRRNRDYLDAVYINPSGTAYWSIIKAYDAFKKHLEEDSDKVKAKMGSSSIAPLSEDLINKLTRQTKKKIADEMKRKRKEDSMTKSAKNDVAEEAEESLDSDESEERLSSYMKKNQKLRGKLSKVDQDSDNELSDDSLDGKRKKVKSEKSSTALKSNPLHGRTSKVIGRCTLLVRGSDQGNNSDFDGYVPYRGKRTVLAWLIDIGTAKLSEKVQYMNRRRTKVMLEGWITRDGIHCGCCSKILTVSKFELHAGSKLRQPFQNIFLESGSSLLQCQIDAWNNQEKSLYRDFFTVDVDGDDPDDDTCAICGDGGDLICCDSCPSTFHQICLGIQMLPSGDWHCPHCICKFCGIATGNVAEENNISCDELNICNFCEKKYHESCSERAHPQPKSSCASFCGLKCQEIYDHFQKIIGVKHELEAGISWSIIQRTDVSDASQRGFPLRVECNSKLAVALSVIDECFLPIIDRRSGINIIHNVVYNCGSNFNRLNYKGFYTAILERGDEIIAAASIRIHGDRLAEMPFIGTRDIYRRQGMCRRLLSAIETVLCTLKVGLLVIPAISEHMNMWTTVFGFHEIDDVHKKDRKSMNMLVFPGTDMLQKQLLVKQENSDGIMVSETTKNQPPLPALIEKSEASLSKEQNKRLSRDSRGMPALEEKSEASLCEEQNKQLSSNSGGSPALVKRSEASLSEERNKQLSSDFEGSPTLIEKSEASLSEEQSKLLSSNSGGSPALDDKSAASLSQKQNKQANSYSGRCPTTSKCYDEVDALDSGPPVPAIPSAALRETDNPAPSASSDAVCVSVELKCSPIPVEDDEENRSLEPSNSPVNAVVEDACKIEDCETLSSADAPAIGNGVQDSSERASEDAGHLKTVSNGCLKPFPASVSEATLEVNNGDSNGDQENSIMALNADSDHRADGTDGVDPAVVQERDELDANNEKSPQLSPFQS